MKNLLHGLFDESHGRLCISIVYKMVFTADLSPYQSFNQAFLVS